MGMVFKTNEESRRKGGGIAFPSFFLWWTKRGWKPKRCTSQRKVPLSHVPSAIFIFVWHFTPFFLVSHSLTRQIVARNGQAFLGKRAEIAIPWKAKGIGCFGEGCSIRLADVMFVHVASDDINLRLNFLTRAFACIPEPMEDYFVRWSFLDPFDSLPFYIWPNNLLFHPLRYFIKTISQYAYRVFLLLLLAPREMAMETKKVGMLLFFGGMVAFGHETYVIASIPRFRFISQ